MICDQLHAIGKGISDQDKEYALLTALDSPDYESFTVSMLRPPIPTNAEMISLLQDHER